MDWGILIPLAGIVMGCTIPMVAIRSKTKLKIAQMNASASAQDTAERAAQYASQVQRLEDRVQVLERIVTDRGYDVATQIEALRDTRRIEDIEDQGSGVPLNTMRKETV